MTDANRDDATDERSPQPVSRRRGPGSGLRLLLAVVGGLLAFALVGIAYMELVLPKSGRADESRIYDYVYAGGKSENSSFVTSNMSAGSRLCLGSSEFYISKDLVPMCPQAVFGESGSGVDMTFVGEGYDQSLWQAIAAGSYARKVTNKKIMLVVSPQWFFKGNGEQSKFSSKFSYSLYQEFCDNPDISDQTRAYVRQRAQALGVGATELRAANGDTPLDRLNAVAYYQSDQLRLRSKLPNVISLAPKKSALRASGEPTGEPDWAALLAQADEEGARRCTNNDYGVYDAYWEKNSRYDPEWYQNFHEADDEYADLACLLRVCREAGLEPLVCILPVHGPWYDCSNVSQDERQYYYQRIRGICDEAGTAYADFSSCEYERYFLCDTVHPGWRGWVRIEEAFYHFVHGSKDAFLGGAGHGSAEGLTSARATQAGEGA